VISPAKVISPVPDVVTVTLLSFAPAFIVNASASLFAPSTIAASPDVTVIATSAFALVDSINPVASVAIISSPLPISVPPSSPSAA